MCKSHDNIYEDNKMIKCIKLEALENWNYFSITVIHNIFVSKLCDYMQIKQLKIYYEITQNKIVSNIV